MPTPLPRWKRALFSLIIFSIVAVGFELSASFYLRITKGYDGRHLEWHVYDSYKNILPAPNYTDTRGIHHNSVGFRADREIPHRKPGDTLRIFLMGGSTAYGLGTMWPHLEREFAVLDDSQTISAYMEERFREILPNVKTEVINAAIASDWTHHHLIYLNQTILRYDPDVVVFLDGYNDYYFRNLDHDQFADYPHQDHANIIMGEPTAWSLVYSNAWWLFRKSAFVHVVGRAARDVGHRLTPAHLQLPIDVQDAISRQKQVFTHNALKMNRRIAAILRTESVKGLFVLQPMLILERDRRGMPEHERELFQYNVDSFRPGYEEYMRGTLPFIRKKMPEAVEQEGANFLDATRAYENAEGQMFTDYCHLTPRGNQILGSLIADAVVESLRKKKKETVP